MARDTTECAFDRGDVNEKHVPLVHVKAQLKRFDGCSSSFGQKS